MSATLFHFPLQRKTTKVNRLRRQKDASETENQDPLSQHMQENTDLFQASRLLLCGERTLQSRCHEQDTERQQGPVSCLYTPRSAALCAWQVRSRTNSKQNEFPERNCPPLSHHTHFRRSRTYIREKHAYLYSLNVYNKRDHLVEHPLPQSPTSQPSVFHSLGSKLIHRRHLAMTLLPPYAHTYIPTHVCTIRLDTRDSRSYTVQ